MERDGRRGYLGVEPFLHIRGKPAVLTRGKERGKIPEQQGEKKSAAQKQREQDAAVQRSWFHRIGSGADSYHKVCKNADFMRFFRGLSFDFPKRLCYNQ